MKKLILLAALLILLVGAPVAYAAETGAVPASAVEALGLLGSLLAAWLGGGRLGNYLTQVVKKWAWIPEEDRSKIAGAWAGLVAIVLTSLSSIAIAYLIPLAERLDETGLWRVLTTLGRRYMLSYQ